MGKEKHPGGAKIDQEKYNKFIEIAIAQLNYEPQNAEITIENGEIKEIAEKDGQVVMQVI